MSSPTSSGLIDIIDSKNPQKLCRDIFVFRGLAIGDRWERNLEIIVLDSVVSKDDFCTLQDWMQVRYDSSFTPISSALVLMVVL